MIQYQHQTRISVFLQAVIETNHSSLWDRGRGEAITVPVAVVDELRKAGAMTNTQKQYKNIAQKPNHGKSNFAKNRYFAKKQYRKLMEATFVVDPQEVDAQLLARMLDFFKGKKEPVRIRLINSSQECFDWQQWFRGMEDIRKRTELVPVDVHPDTDINNLID